MEPRSHAGSPSSCPYTVGLTPLHGQRLEQDLDAVYADLRRRRGPVAAVEIDPGVTAWLVLPGGAGGRLEHGAVLQRPTPVDHPGPRTAARGLAPAAAPRPPARRVPARRGEHLQHRRATTAALGHIDLRQLSRLVRHRANALVDALAARGTADLVAEYSRPLVWHVFAHPPGVSEDVITTIDPLVKTIANALPCAAPAEADLLNALRRLVAERSVAPGPDLASWPAQEAPLTDDEIAHNLLDLVLIGGEGAVSRIGNAVRVFPAQDGPAAATRPGDLVPRLVEHALCTAAPLPNTTGRWATADTVLAGYRMHAGDLVIPCLAAANADPELQDTPALRTRAHLAWGTDSHGCRAEDAARPITETAVEVLLNRLPGIRPGIPDAALRRPSPWCGAPAPVAVVFPATGPARTGRDPVAPPATVMDAPAELRDDGATGGAAPQRWGCWNSFGGGW
ncbi:hypothetical protein [Streptomyces sp. NPDC020362]|uniref:hypothetical protein n=1 Tax=unclassified Streptomyces TaxID=2593676 RepID=UPI0033CD2730